MHRGILPYILNGVVNNKIDSEIEFWTFEAVTWILLPVCIYLYLTRVLLIKNKDLGLDIKGKIDRKFTVMVFLCSIVLPVLYFYSKNIGDILFPVDYWDTGFRYQSKLPQGFWSMELVIIYFSVSAGVVEEFYFRGFFYKILEVEKNRDRKWIYIVLSSIIFSLIHFEFGIRNMFSVFLWSLVVSGIYVYYRSLLPLIIGHIFTDMLVFNGIIRG